MNNLYHKIAVASVCTALSFALGANKEAKAATITLRELSFFVVDSNYDGLGDWYYGTSPLPVGDMEYGEARSLYEFNLANLSLTSTTIITQAIFQGNYHTITGHRYFKLHLFGYRGNGEPNPSDFEAGKYLPDSGEFTSGFNVTPFINELVSNNDTFAGFSFRSNGWGQATLSDSASLIITTVDIAEPVPEPTTIFGSAIGLCLGGWLKRKKSSQQNKTTLQR
jgi:hypothetical protein